MLNKDLLNEQSNLNNEFPQEIPLPERTPWHPEKARMLLAYWVLGGIFSVFVITIVVNHLAKIDYVDDGLSLALFELCKTGLLPIVTLILGYYFSKSN